ncbi:MAG TPA: DUF4350 domain-containing protein [Chitinophagales bacterium]|nr:DUF4350 domain-containing protein [Chitinophagales bacterium]
MKGSTTAWIVLIAAVFSLLIFLLYRALTAPVVWYEFYRADEKQPYDLLVTSTLLHDYFPGKKFSIGKKALSSSLPSGDNSKTCYVFIGHSIFLSSDDRERLFDFVREGNEAFIAANQFPTQLFVTLLKNYNFDRDYLYRNDDSVASMNFSNWQLRADSAYPFEYVFNWSKESYEWMVFNDSILHEGDENAILLGSLNEAYPNFIKIPYGKGAFYLHSDPIVFTNYELKEEQRLMYVEKVFSHFQPADIYWDEFSKIPQSMANNAGNNGDNESPLRYILSQPSLKWAWYVLLGIAVLFMMFRTKRTRRMIPVLEQNTNSSLEYIQTISRLYFMQNDHRLLALQQMKLFLTFIRNRYQLQTKQMDADFIKKLSVKSQIADSKIKHISDEFRTINNMVSIDRDHLIEFHSMLDQFYMNCK